MQLHRITASRLLGCGRAASRSLSTPGSINFQDPRPVRRAKTRPELLRSLAVLRFCSVDAFVSRALLWMRIGRRLLGRRAFDALMRRSFFGQFVGGATEAELRRTVERQLRQGTMPMILVPMEEPISRIEGAALERLYEENTDKQVRAVELSAELNSRQPKMQLKVTAMMPTSVLRALAAGCDQTAASPAMLSTASALAELLAGPPGRCPQEGGHGGGSGRLLSDVDERFSGQLTAGVDRMRRVFDAARRLSVQVLIDAEYSHINAGISLFYLALAMLHSAGPRCLVYNTYQCYLRDALPAYTGQTDLLLARGVRAGAKLVRGAYLDWENGEGAALHSGRSHAWSSLEETNASYDRVVAAALERVAGHGGRHEVMLASHNTRSIGLCLDAMRARGLAHDSGLVSFGQQYGMADHISFPLSELGCRVYKSIPYGSVDETLPYLARRASENRLIFGRIREERRVLWAALRGRSSC